MSSADESHSVGWKLYIFYLFTILSAPTMTTDVSQVGVTLFPSFLHFLWFHLSRFSFYINKDLKNTFSSCTTIFLCYPYFGTFLSTWSFPFLYCAILWFLLFLRIYPTLTFYNSTYLLLSQMTKTFVM